MKHVEKTCGDLWASRQSFKSLLIIVRDPGEVKVLHNMSLISYTPT